MDTQIYLENFVQIQILTQQMWSGAWDCFTRKLPGDANAGIQDHTWGSKEVL